MRKFVIASFPVLGRAARPPNVAGSVRVAIALDTPPGAVHLPGREARRR